MRYFFRYHARSILEMYYLVSIGRLHVLRTFMKLIDVTTWQEDFGIRYAMPVSAVLLLNL